MKNKAINALIEMGMPANIKGFNYIVDAMCLLKENTPYFSSNIGRLYEKIAKRYNTTYSKVERAIRYAFSCVLDNGTDSVKKYLSGLNTANGNLLNLLYLRLT